MPCRFNRRRMWTHRMVLESYMHSESCFLTLTYDDDHLPEGGTLVPRDVQLFIKHLRTLISPIKIRYFLVGEYGDNSNRPHYHAAIFGISYGFTEIMQKAWRKGHIMVGDLTKHSAQYIAGYTVKKMTSKEDPRLNGLYPEFARMSLRPGIGALAVPDLSNAMSHKSMVDFINSTGDIPNSIKIGTKSVPLGRYLRRKIRERLGLYDLQTGEIGKAPAQVQILDAFRSELQALRLLDEDYENLSLKEVIVDVNKQKVLNMETRTKIYQSRKVL